MELCMRDCYINNLKSGLTNQQEQRGWLPNVNNYCKDMRGILEDNKSPQAKLKAGYCYLHNKQAPKEFKMPYLIPQEKAKLEAIHDS
jgi:hypothetical protein